jgi:hypothetical protein
LEHAQAAEELKKLESGTGSGHGQPALGATHGASSKDVVKGQEILGVDPAGKTGWPRSSENVRRAGPLVRMNPN